MSTTTIPKLRVSLCATGSYVPEHVVSNDYFASSIDTSDEWIRTRTGIRERRYAGPNDTCSTMAIAAAQAALRKAELSPQDLDLIICATVTSDLMTPSTANLIQAGLGCRPIPSFDISAACTGFLYALSVGQQYLLAGAAKNVMVVGAEVLTRVIDQKDRNTCILFGDGAGAAILSTTTECNRGFQSIRLYSDATNGKLIRVPGIATFTPTGERAIHFLEMNGREVFKFAVCRMIEMIEQAMVECRQLGLKIDCLIPHQVNRRIIDSALETTGFPPEKVMVNLDRYGNTSAASVPIALDEAISEGRIHRGDTILLVAFGGGLTWGSALITV